jgi:hypothetical protein
MLRHLGDLQETRSRGDAGIGENHRKRIERTGNGSNGNMSCSRVGLLFSDSCVRDSYLEIPPALFPETRKPKTSNHQKTQKRMRGNQWKPTNNKRIRSNYTSPNSCLDSAPLIPTLEQICDKRTEQTRQNSKKRPGTGGERDETPRFRSRFARLFFQSCRIEPLIQLRTLIYCYLRLISG